MFQIKIGIINFPRLLIFSLLFVSLISADDIVPDIPPDYKEINYYLKKLQETQLEDERVKYNKIIHEAVVNNDLSDKKVVKAMGPLIEKLEIARDSDLDRTSITGQSMWLGSAIEYFHNEKLRPRINVPPSEWMENQTSSLEGKSISVFPGKIILHENDVSQTIAEMSKIHEAIISPDGSKVAFFRVPNEKNDFSEIWVLNLKKNKLKNIAQASSCYTLLFSLDGKRLFFQEKVRPGQYESGLFSVSATGGKPRHLSNVAKLMTVVQSGRYKNNLIVYKNRLHHLGVTRLECPAVITSSGKELGQIVDSPCH